uniref:Radical SAM protein n=1 Tax=Desulfobacca acetoxidans TaxID=60893 RepID=A0A7C5EN16_9BACT
MELRLARRQLSRCDDCGYCTAAVLCPGEERCSGCGACVAACPREARELVVRAEVRPKVELVVDGRPVRVPERLTLLQALELTGYEVGTFPGEGRVTAPCRTGGCWACAVLVDGEVQPSCITPVRAGMVVKTDPEKVAAKEPRRLVFGFSGHMVGGVGTPWEAKAKRSGWLEVACFAAGCILRCPTCQNWETTFRSRGEPLTPELAAILLTRARWGYGVDRLAISGGECTLNRRWLVDFLRHLKELNPDPAARLHVDTNSVFLTPDYLMELLDAGLTDIGCDIKALELSTFQRITGTAAADLAARLLKQGWEAVAYLLTELWGRVFVGIGLPYNAALISSEELAELAAKLAALRPEVQVTVLDYRPEFRRPDLVRPGTAEMLGIKRLLERTGLRKVICQTYRGHLGPE